MVYAAKGNGAGAGSLGHDLSPGDFTLIPAFTEHQEVNDSDEDVVWVIICGGRNPIVESLDGWSKKVSQLIVSG
jgi:hypothetical protein